MVSGRNRKVDINVLSGYRYVQVNLKAARVKLERILTKSHET